MGKGGSVGEMAPWRRAYLAVTHETPARSGGSARREVTFLHQKGNTHVRGALPPFGG